MFSFADIMLYPVDVDDVDKATRRNVGSIIGSSMDGSINNHLINNIDLSDGHVVKLMPNMTLLLNISKDELERASSSGIPSSLKTGSLPDHDQKSIQSESESDTSTLSGPEIASGSVSKVRKGSSIY